MQLGETIATYDVALALRDENGKFDVTSPNGEIYHVTCKSGQSIMNLQWSGYGGNHQPFLIRKVAEPVANAPEKTAAPMTQIPVQPSVPKTPFLIASDDDDLLSEKIPAIVPPPQEHKQMFVSEAICDLDLIYEELDPKTQQPAASVRLRSGSPGAHTRLTPACASFIAFDVEIRRLHAQLDDIRYRARKRFYQAQEIAAGA